MLPEGLEGEQRGQQAFDPGLGCMSSIPARAELDQEAPHASTLALLGLSERELLPGWSSTVLLDALLGSPKPQYSLQVLEKPSQHNEQGGKKETHQTQPAQVLELHHRLLEPLISSGPDGNFRTCQAE